jgi:hypothetical protein
MIVLIVCFLVLVGRPILIHYKIILPIQLSSMACLAYPKLFDCFQLFWSISMHLLLHNMLRWSFSSYTRQYFVNEDDTVPQKVAQEKYIKLMCWDIVVIGEFTSSYICCCYRWLFRRTAGAVFTSVVPGLVRGYSLIT